tara:strand:+ start:30 stop:938 length:909 start_codon:yes stop_codon:yes gene_type:complete
MMSDDAPPPQPAASSGLAEESTGQHLANAVNAQFKLHANVDDLAGATPNDPARATLARRPEQYGVLKQRMMDACDSAIDGAFVNMWILFSINHYDLRQERVLVLTEKSVLRIKLDFYAVKVQRVTRMLLSEIESVTFGPFQYEEGSMSAQVAEKGKASLAGVDAAQGTEALKIQLKQAAPPSFLDKWNPIASKIGETVTVVTSHLRAGESVRSGRASNRPPRSHSHRPTAPNAAPHASRARRTRRSTTWSRSSTSSARSLARYRAASRRSARRSSPSARPSGWSWPWRTTRAPSASGARASS